MELLEELEVEAVEVEEVEEVEVEKVEVSGDRSHQLPASPPARCPPLAPSPGLDFYFFHHDDDGCDKGRMASPKLMNFRKSSKRPLTPPPSFSENHIADFATKL